MYSGSFSSSPRLPPRSGKRDSNWVAFPVCSSISCRKRRVVVLVLSIWIAFFSSLLAYAGVSTASETAGNLLADLDLNFGLILCKCLIICIYSDKCNALDTALDHSVNSIASAAADTNNLDARDIRFIH